MRPLTLTAEEVKLLDWLITALYDGRPWIVMEKEQPGINELSRRIQEAAADQR